MSKVYDNAGTISKNEKARPDSRDPNLSGQCLIEGVAFWVSGWTKDSDRGKFISLAFRRKDAAAKGPGPSPKASHDDQDYPF